MVARFRRRVAKNRVTRRPRRAIGFPVTKTVTLKFVDYIPFPGTDTTGAIANTETVSYHMNNPQKPRHWTGAQHQPMNWDQYAMIYQSFKCLRSRMYIEISPRITPSDILPLAYIVEPIYPSGLNVQPPPVPEQVTSCSNVLENGGRYFCRAGTSHAKAVWIRFVCQWSPKGRTFLTGATQSALPGQSGFVSARGGTTDGDSLPEPLFEQRITSWPSDDVAARPFVLGYATLKVAIYYTIQFRRGSTTLAQN